VDRVRDLTALAARIGIGVIFIAHGWQKFAQDGIGATAAQFAQLGVPAPTLSALYAVTVELAGGAALIVGFALPVAGIAIVLDMAGAFLFVHVGFPLISPRGGELVVALGLAALYLGFAGGKYSVDTVLFNALRNKRSVTA